MKKFAIWVILLSLAHALSGCAIDQGHDESMCPRDVSCVVKGQTMWIRDFNVNGNSEQDGIVLAKGAKHFVIENGSINGTRYGFLVDFEACLDCSVELRNVTISVNWFGIAALGEGGRLYLLNVNITTGVFVGGGVESEGGFNETRLRMMGWRSGIYLPSFFETHGSACGVHDPVADCCYPNPHISLVAESVHVKALPTKNMRIGAVQGPVPAAAIGGGTCPIMADLALRDVTLEGFSSGVEFWPTSAQLADVQVSCSGSRDGSGIRIGNTGSGVIVVERTQVSGCGGSGLLVSGEAARLDKVSVRGARKGIENEVNSIDVSNFAIRDTDYGIWGYLAPGGANYVNGTIENATYLGIHSGNAWQNFTDVAFLKNGLGWPDPDSDTAAPSAYGAIEMALVDVGLGRATLRSCSFMGNEPYAMAADSPVDATNNWWGAADGPAVRVADGVAQGGHGDNVTLLVQYVPFLTAPPSTGTAVASI